MSRRPERDKTKPGTLIHCKRPAMSFLGKARHLTTTARSSISRSSSCRCRRIASPSLDLGRSAFSSVAETGAPNVAGVVGGENVLVFPSGGGSAASAVVKPVMPTLLQPRVVIYDGVCHLCHRGVKWVIRADKHKKIKFCCLQSQAAEPYMKLCGLQREDVLRRFLFIESPGLYHQASTAALRVMSYLPLPYSALSALLLVPSPVRDGVYDYVAKKRYGWFGKEDECLVLREQDLLDRFIDRDEILEKSRSAL
ncbi:hypothetical protein SAY86_002646 [Trapa natans]|uniref:Thiol-disulfide oxidoreductase DCC n=1 Tax=Trapa natans TaxID=22666 RepID=A0AAN7R168_TRANT|nr:hypothetical protein SAY86_002646 [Trapa natans]